MQNLDIEYKAFCFYTVMDFFESYPALVDDLCKISGGWVLPYRITHTIKSSNSGMFYFYVTPKDKKTFSFFLDDYDGIVSYIRKKYLINKNIKSDIVEVKSRVHFYKRFW